MQAVAEVKAPEVPSISPVDWMRCKPWLRARRAYLMGALFHEGAHLHVADHGLHKARIDALAIFDGALAALELEELNAER